MKPRILVLPFAAAVIAGLVIYKLKFAPVPPPATERDRTPWKEPPPIELFNQHGKMSRLKSYLGRFRVLVLFYDAEEELTQNSWLLRLQSAEDQLADEDIRVLAVSTALPQQHRKLIDKQGPFPFPLLSDPAYEASSRWGRFDFDRKRILPAMFLIDRAGRMPYTEDGTVPRPIAEPDGFLNELLQQ